MTLRRLALTLSLAAACCVPAGCASDAAVRPTAPRPSVERPEPMLSDAAIESRAAAAEQRAAMRSAMGVREPASRELGDRSIWDGVGDVLGAIGRTAVDVVSLRTFGLW